jgi:hypothetical protein
MGKWIFEGGVTELQPVMCAGINLWEHPWEREQGVTIDLPDPIYQQIIRLNVFRVAHGDRVLRFAVKEVSASVYVFYDLGDSPS